MEIVISPDKKTLGQAAAHKGSALIQETLKECGSANVILATGASQFEMIAELVQQPIDWKSVTFFHLDEYIGLPETHPASFRKYLKERFVQKVNAPNFYFIDGEADIETECKRLSELIETHPIDVAFIGIGENAHLAFNDPPADFETDVAYMEVKLDFACRRQQMGEGWFSSLEDVPSKAITMTIPQIMKAKHIICTVPDRRKAAAVAEAVQEEITPRIPASILQKHPNATLFLDEESASLLKD